jgi:hypothetical protein
MMSGLVGSAAVGDAFAGEIHQDCLLRQLILILQPDFEIDDMIGLPVSGSPSLK